MTQPTILVTGATGNTGGAVVSELLHRGGPVRAMVRMRDSRSAALEARGAEVVVADLFDPDQLVAALRGAQRAYFVPPYTPYTIQSAVAFAIAAREAKLEAIVQMSQWTSHRNHPALMTRQTWLMDRMFAEFRGVARLFPPAHWQRQSSAGCQRGHRTDRGCRADGTGTSRRKNLSAHRTATAVRSGDGGHRRNGGRPSSAAGERAVLAVQQNCPLAARC